MKHIAFILILLSTLCFGCRENNMNNDNNPLQCGCEEENMNNDDPIQSLEGTRWKLVGIVDAKTCTLQVLEPTDCEKCYTLAFDTDSTFSTFSATNDLWGSYKIDYKTGEIFIHCDLMTEVGAMGDESLYIKTLNRAQSFLLKNKELKLYYLNTNKNSYMLFKPF